MVSIDMPAGPSEVLVIADRYANPVHVAADLLSQVLICLSSSHLIFFTMHVYSRILFTFFVYSKISSTFTTGRHHMASL